MSVRDVKNLSVFQITPKEVDWLRENHPTNYQNLQAMFREGTAKLSDDQKVSG
jgi:uncharacterized protein YaeQ